MTKIPSVEELIKSLPKHYSNVRCSEYYQMVPLSAVRQALQAQRDAGAREVLLSIQKIVAESRTVEEEYGIGNGEATARAQVIADIQVLTQPTK